MIIDVLVILIIGGSAITAGKRGLIRTLYQLGSSIIALALAFLIQPFVQSLLKETPLYMGLQTWIADKMPALSESAALQQQNSFIAEATEWMPNFIGDYLIRNNNPEVYRLLGVNDVTSYMTVWIADLCIMILAVMISWIIVKIGLEIIMTTLDVVSKLPILKTVNQVVGFGVGAVKGVFQVWILFALVPIFLLVPEFSILEQWMQEAVLGQYLYNHNIIVEIINHTIMQTF